MKVNCYYCKQIIENKDDICEQKISDKTTRKLHKNCLDNFLFERHTKCCYCKKSIKINSSWDKETNHKNDYQFFHIECKEKNKEKVLLNKQWQDLYFYVKNNIFFYPEEFSFNSTQVLALKNLTNKKILTKGAKQRYDGYSYEEILYAFILLKPDILKAIEGKEFKNDNQKMVYIVKIVSSYINDILINRIKRLENNDKIDKIIVAEDFSEKYQKKETYNKSLYNLINDESW